MLKETTAVSKTDLTIRKITKTELPYEFGRLVEPSINVGKDEIRQEVAGIAHICSLNKLRKQIQVINNFQPSRIFSVQLDLMNLGAKDETRISLPVQNV